MAFAWEVGQLRAIGLRIVTGLALTVIGLTCATEAAGAKVLPVASVAVVTAHPRAGQPLEVVLRFRAGFDLGDFEWEDFEVSVLAARLVDRHGWPLDREDRGTPVPLRRIGPGEYRGSLTIERPGDYVVLDASSMAARTDREQGVINIVGQYPAPQRVRVVSTVAAVAPKPDPSSFAVVGLVLAAIVIAGVGVVVVRSRTRRRRASDVSAQGIGYSTIDKAWAWASVPESPS